MTHDQDLSALLDLEARVLFFPVRHHSPTAARFVSQLIQRRRPQAVLIEGPADFNDRIDELFLPHRPPLAIYSYLRLPTGQRRGAYYPLCEHSPEWQALLAAHKIGAAVRFIDLPWAEIATAEQEPDNRYSDAEFRRSGYIAALCKRLGVEDFNTLWDTLFELDANINIEIYLQRAHHLCGNMRFLEGVGSATDRRREAFMADRIRQACDEHSGQILVVTGGYHSAALHARLQEKASEGTTEYTPQPPVEGEERGIALTPYSFERLDSLAGYEAGMPNPGFYQQVWSDRRRGRTGTHRTLLRRIARRLRENKQAINSADLIAAETTARGLAALRGHAEVWRIDLVDGIISSLIKEEMARGGRHPLLDAVQEVLRGGERGLLAENAPLPPLVMDIRTQLESHDLQARTQPRDVDLDLHAPPDRERSRVLHRLRLLGIDGYERTADSAPSVFDEGASVEERWRIVWNPDFDARCIESARYGPTLAEAATARLTEAVEGIERDASQAAALLLDAALAGITALADSLLVRLQTLIRSDGNFFTLTSALGHLLHLFRYDVVLETAGRGEIGTLVFEAFQRGLWLLEGLGQVTGQNTALLDGLRILRETLERCEQALALDRVEFVQVLARIGADRNQRPLVRGGVLGAQWSLGSTDGEQVKSALKHFADADQLGDFLTGLFALAREQVQRQQDLVLAINGPVTGYGDEDFLAALPALRLAFTYFTPREKHHLALTLREALGLKDMPEIASLTVDAVTAERALAFESRLFQTLDKYGIRGGVS